MNSRGPRAAMAALGPLDPVGDLGEEEGDLCQVGQTSEMHQPRIGDLGGGYGSSVFFAFRALLLRLKTGSGACLRFRRRSRARLLRAVVRLHTR